MLNISQHRHAQDRHGLSYTVHLQRAEDKYIQENDAFEKCARIIPSPQAL